MSTTTAPRSLLLTTLATTICMIAFAAAQTGPQAALIPPCVVCLLLLLLLLLLPTSAGTTLDSSSKSSKTLTFIRRGEQKTCDPPAIASVNCTLEDQYCHCVRQDGILTNISACAEKSCEEPEEDLFGMLPFCRLIGKKNVHILSTVCLLLESLPRLNGWTTD
jgi:hypothetical protein